MQSISLIRFSPKEEESQSDWVIRQGRRCTKWEKTYIYIYKYTNNIKIFKNMSANDFLGILSEVHRTHKYMYIWWYGSGDVMWVLFF